jgi:pyruvate-ferredoxin/flavodoxin oxidoreductase
MESETRFAMLARSHPEAAQHFLEEAQKDAERRFKTYQEMALDRPSGAVTPEGINPGLKPEK